MSSLQQAHLAEHGLEQKHPKAPSQALTHAGEAILLQHARDDGASANACKDDAPLGHLRDQCQSLITSRTFTDPIQAGCACSTFLRKSVFCRSPDSPSLVGLQSGIPLHCWDGSLDCLFIESFWDVLTKLPTSCCMTAGSGL